MLALLATLAAALDVRRHIDRRRAGEDPTAQEEERLVRAFLARQPAQISDEAYALRLSVVLGPQGDEAVEAGQVVTTLLLTRKLRRRLQLVHQRLLSLYPAVDEALVESARRLEQDLLALLDQPEYAQVAHVADDVLHFATQLDTNLF